MCESFLLAPITLLWRVFFCRFAYILNSVGMNLKINESVVKMAKPVNYLAQTGALEDLVGSIKQDAETEEHYDRLKLSLERDLKHEENEHLQTEIIEKLQELEREKNNVRSARYRKTNIALTIAEKVADGEHETRFSCAFKHQLKSMAEMQDAMGAIEGEPELLQELEDVYFLTASNTAFVISKFLGLPVESCMACLFENNKIELAKG